MAIEPAGAPEILPESEVFWRELAPPRLRGPVAFIAGDALKNPLDVLKTLIYRRADEYAEGGFEYPVANKGRNVFPCWEATTEPVYKDDDGTFLVHRRHQATMEDGTTILLKSAEVGFALAEYSLGDDAEPVKLTYVDECHAKFLQREARLKPKPAANRRRRQPVPVPEATPASQPAPVPEASLASKPASLRKRRTPAPTLAPPGTPLRSSRPRRS